MKDNRRLIPIIVIVIVILAILAGAYFIVRPMLDKGPTALTASGTIESVSVTISPEIGGKVAEVLVDEGATVKTGDVLFRLDEALLQAQRAVAAAGLDSANAAASSADAAVAIAQAQYNLTLDSARAESAATRTASWKTASPSEFDQPNWYFSQADQITAAQNEVEAASSALTDAQTNLANVQDKVTSTGFMKAETRLADARVAFLVAKDVLDRASASNNTDLRDAAQEAYDNAKAELDAAQKAYAGDLSSQAAQDVLTARAEQAAAQERYDTAQDRLLALQTGEDSPRVTTASAAVKQARAAADQAALAVKQAQANLSLIDTQIGKLAVKAPADGVILTRDVEPGEVVSAGATAMTLGRLDNLTITVYVPEDRYGEISLGETASVAVDSFPDQSFTAKVIHIADQAEFTPRNVQTVEGRKSTTFAIKLQVDASGGKLKPGMPADVTFSR